MSAGQIEIAFRGELGRFQLDAAFSAPARGVTGLFGPSGCGKTTVLRGVAGLQRFARGRCVVDGEIWQEEGRFLPPHERPIGYVFQEASLFPHLSVRANLLYGAPRRGRAGLALDDVVSLLGLAGLIDRRPGRLSGGERQRVAIGRALMSRPKLLLMDEPISALDAPTRDEILPFLDRLHRSLELPILYVAHDRAEIERLADHLVLMQAGRIVASGSLSTLWGSPASVSLAARVTSFDAQYGLATFAVAGGQLRAWAPDAQLDGSKRLRIQAADVGIACGPPRRTSVANLLPARVLGSEPANGRDVMVTLGLGEDGAGDRLLARLTRWSWDALALKAGDSVVAEVRDVVVE